MHLHFESVFRVVHTVLDAGTPSMFLDIMVTTECLSSIGQ